jgi:hypothetical protein
VKRVLFLSVTIIGLSAALFAQQPPQAAEPELPFRLGGSNGPKLAKPEPNRPAPRLADGKIDLSGLWSGGGDAPVGRLLKPGELDSILKPEAKKLMASRKIADDPYFACMPGGPLRITGGFGWRLLQHPTTNSTHIFMIQEGNAHSYRQIFMNAKHPEDPSPDVVRPLDRPLGLATRWLSTPSGSTTSSGSIAPERRTAKSFTWWSDGRVPTTPRSSAWCASRIPTPSRVPSR